MQLTQGCPCPAEGPDGSSAPRSPRVWLLRKPSARRVWAVLGHNALYTAGLSIQLLFSKRKSHSIKPCSSKRPIPGLY